MEIPVSSSRPILRAESGPGGHLELLHWPWRTARKDRGLSGLYPRAAISSASISISACHDHPEVKGQLDYVPRGVSRLREYSKDQKVVWNCVECTRIGNLNARATPKEVRSEVWMSLIHGSMGLIYFVHQFKPVECEYQLLQDPEMLAEVTRTNFQDQQLAPALNSPSLPDHAFIASSNPKLPVAGMVKQLEDTTYLFTASTKSGETEATFRLATPSRGTIKVIGENRTLEISNGSFRDTFKDWDVHLYQVQP